MLRVFIGMETSGQLRRRFAALGHDVISCDTLPAEDVPTTGLHLIGDVFVALEKLMRAGWVPDVGVFHPTCTYHTVSAAWAFNDPDFERYPGVGYHQKVKPETLTGAARRQAREEAEADVERIRMLPFVKLIENPRGTIPTRTSLGPPADILQPYEFGDDASKATCIWIFDAEGDPISLKLHRDPARRTPGRMVEWPRGSGQMAERWANQTDSNQNNLTPGEDRWKDRSRTYPGIGSALVTAALEAVTKTGSQSPEPLDL